MVQEDSDADISGEWRDHLPIALLAIAMVVSAWLGLSLNSGLTFYADEWDPLLNRPGWGLDQIFAPFNGHPTMIPMVIYKAVQEIFGMDSTRPVQIVHATLLLAMNGVLFVYLRRRVGDWTALIATVMILFLGAAFEVLIYSFTINFTGAITAGIGALLMLERDDRKGDLAAAALLVLGACISMVILPFIAAAAVEWILNPRDRRNRIFVPGASVLFLLLWWVVWGRQGESSFFSAADIPAIPGHLFASIGAGFTALFGLANGANSGFEQPNLIWGKLMAVGAAILAAWRIRSLKGPPRDFLMILAGLAVLEISVVLGGRDPIVSRFLLPTAIFILMGASTLLRGVVFRTSWLVVAGIVAVLSVQGGVRLWESKANGRWVVASQLVRSYVTGLELAGQDTKPDAKSGFERWEYFELERFTEAFARYGSPSFERGEWAGLKAKELTSLDQGLIAASGVGLDSRPPKTATRTCGQTIPGQVIKIKPGRYRVENSSNSEVSINVARLAPDPGTSIGAVLQGSAAGLNLPAGDLGALWRITLEPSSGAVRICGR
ncbi:MAG: hypothetical protein WEB05_00180 [Solirubrobacterales bacterium]